MNRITLVDADYRGRRYFDIEVDGIPLRDYFIGRNGARPSQLSPVGWQGAEPGRSLLVTDQLLLRVDAGLQSGRVPILVCEECGDLGCGAFAVRISRNDSVVDWTDWAWENGYESAKDVDDWPKRPGPFRFSWAEYEMALIGRVASV
jgi:hypothetical protein